MAILLVPSPVKSLAQRSGPKLKGVAFLALVTLLIGLTIAIYNRTFVPTEDVSLLVPSAGHQLLPDSDVKLRGVIVGRVKGLSNSNGMARLHLALKPDKVSVIPPNVEARILPKTLFGEKFVQLVIPDNPAPGHIKSGAVITQDRSSNGLEVENVLNDLEPLLTTVQPEKLNETLNALATALQGRGAKLGDNLVSLDDYLKRFNPHLPQFENDLSGLADFADSLQRNAPELLRILRNQVVTLSTIRDKAGTYVDFLRGTQDFATTTTRFLQRNGDNIIKLNSLSTPILQTIVDRVGSLPIVINNLAVLTPRVNAPFQQGHFFHITLRSSPDRGVYSNPKDCPSYPGMAGRCGGGSAGTASYGGDTNYGGSVDSIGSPEEKALVSSLLSQELAVTPQDVGDVGTLVMGPVFRGNEVNVA